MTIGMANMKKDIEDGNHTGLFNAGTVLPKDLRVQTVRNTVVSAPEGQSVMAAGNSSVPLPALPGLERLPIGTRHSDHRTVGDSFSVGVVR